MKNLTSISEHSDYLENTFTFDAIKWDLHRKRVEFGKQPLEKWMFIPCDEDGNVLENPDLHGQYHKNRMIIADESDRIFVIKCVKYEKAKERCLFEGCVYDEEMDAVRKDIGLMIYSVKYDSNDIIEDLVKYNLQLTPTALKTLGL